MNNTAAATNFEAELAEVQRILLAAADDLGAPLGELVRSRVRRSFPPIRAAVILAIAESAGEPSALQQQRILLASALEMLYVAMHVHRLLVTRTQDGNDDPAPDRAYMGGAILAGDYCFSRAAQMAARTDNPQVVRIFAQTLQTISEGLLRQHFETGAGTEFDEHHELLRAGALAAAALVNLDEAATAQAVALAQEIAGRGHGQHLLSTGDAGAPQPWPARQHALRRWLTTQYVNGKPFPAAADGRA